MKTNQLLAKTLAASAILAGLLSCGMKEDSIGYPSFDGTSMAGMEMDDMNSGDKFEEFKDNPFIKVSEEPVSTFSVDADGASYGYVRRILEAGRLPDKQAVRIEEFLNYFTFDYPDPEDGSLVRINAEVGACPWSSRHSLLRLGIKGKDIYSHKVPLCNFVFLIDVSGSMYSEDKLPLLKKCLSALVDQMNPEDRISIVTYAGSVEKLLESTPVSESGKIKKAIGNLAASGSTSGGAGMKMAYEECLECFIEGGNNRVIMGTDGDFNVGVTSTDALLEMVQNYAKKGIYLTVCGFGTGNLNDSMMETVSNKGNGTYHYIDSELEMTKVFIEEKNRFFPVANDCKCQVTFNPMVVDSYRLIGYENRVMSKDDFENDKADAAEIGAGQTITALYEIIHAREIIKDFKVATFDFRYKDRLGDSSIPLSLDVVASELENMSANLQFAAGIASFGMLLRKSEYAGESTFNLSKDLIHNSLENQTELPESQKYLRKQLIELVDRAAGLE